jgi:hypothetical protein
MSRNYSASQFDKEFAPHRLGNWEVPDVQKRQKTSTATSPTCKTVDGRTIPIVDERGHLLGKKRDAAFDRQPPVYAQSAPRWPEVGRLRPKIAHSGVG